MRTANQTCIVAALVAFTGVAAPAAAQSGQVSTNVETPGHETGSGNTNGSADARGSVSHPMLMTAVQDALGEKAPESVRLTPAQTKDVEKLHAAFDKQVREFIRKHADPKASASSNAEIPDRESVERKVLDVLRADQRAAVESRLKEAIARAADSRTASDSRSSHSSQSGRDSTSSHSSNSSSSSQSSSSSHSSSDRQSDSQSARDSRSSRNSQSSREADSDRKSSRDNRSSNDRQRNSSSQNKSRQEWSRLDDNARRAVLRSLLDQVSARDREAILKDSPDLAPEKR